MKAFGSYHPLVSFVYFISVLLIAMFAVNPIIQISALVGGCMFCFMLQSKGRVLSDIGFYVPLFFLVSVTNPLFSHNGVTPLFFLNGNPVTLEAVIYGIAIAVTVIGVMMWCKCYSEIITTDKFLYLFSRIVPKISLIISMALRFIPNFKRQLKRVSRAQKAMGMYSSKSYYDRIRNAMRIFMAMISWSLENSIEVSLSMKARGYGVVKRTTFSLFRFRKNDVYILSAIVLLSLVSLFGIAMGETIFYYYPSISAINFSPLAVTAYISYGIIATLPFIIEFKEAALWKYYISKI